MIAKQRQEAAAKAQYERVEGKWEDATDVIKSEYVASAEVGLAAADAVLFSDEVKLRLTKTLFAHHVSDGAGETAPEIIDQCESAVEAIFAVLKAVANE